MAFKLRQMHLLNEGVKTSGGAIVVPTAYADGFTDLEESRR